MLMAICWLTGMSWKLQNLRDMIRFRARNQGQTRGVCVRFVGCGPMSLDTCGYVLTLGILNSASTRRLLWMVGFCKGHSNHSLLAGQVGGTGMFGPSSESMKHVGYTAMFGPMWESLSLGCTLHPSHASWSNQSCHRRKTSGPIMKNSARSRFACNFCQPEINLKSRSVGIVAIGMRLGSLNALFQRLAVLSRS